MQNVIVKESRRPSVLVVGAALSWGKRSLSPCVCLCAS